MAEGADGKAGKARWGAGFLSFGFRPFFLLGSAYAAIAAGLWLAALSGAIVLPTAFDALAWHRHEMLFGFVGAIVAGFLLTAVPNWTGAAPLAGGKLAGLVLLWAAARLAVATGGLIGVWPAALLDGAFLLSIALWAFLRVRAAGNRNRPIPLVIALLALCALGDHAGLAGAAGLAETAYNLGLSLIVILIALIGGRILPAFTRNWLAATGRGEPLPPAFGRFDALAIAATAVALLAWSLAPASRTAAGLLLAAGLLQLARLLRWRGERTLGEPLMAALHLAYAWLPAGLLLLGASGLGAPLPPSAALHALTAGAMGAMTLAVMTRAALGHTGRPLEAGVREIAIFALVHLGALGRVIGAAFPGAYMTLLVLSGLLWAGAFALFAISYAPILLRPPLGR